MARQNFVTVKGKETKPKVIAKNIIVRFRHKAEVGWNQVDSRVHTIDEYAMTAASWQYHEQANNNVFRS